MISEKVELEKVLQLIRNEIETSEVAKKILELDSKLVELKKAVEGIVIELTYIKSELKDLRENGREKKAVLQPKESERIERIERQVKAEEAKIDTIKREKSEIEKKAEKVEEAQKGDDKDLIICD
jgi:chromosome segregation ATPase